MAGIEPAASAWKAEVLPLYDIRIFQLTQSHQEHSFLINNFESKTNGGGGWIRTTEAYASDLQSDPFGRSGTPPKSSRQF